jgi:hypothetical protein
MYYELKFSENSDMTRSVVFILLLHCIVDAFSPCSPPRFDTFCEKLSGSWKYSNDVDGTDMHHIHAVEEVMRSCGGAVQGIREGLQYFNRADDGFVFFDCGTYSYGSVNVISPSSLGATTTSLGPLSTSMKQRLWISSSMNECGILMERFNSDSLKNQNPKITA